MTEPIETSTPKGTSPALYVLQMLATELVAAALWGARGDWVVRENPRPSW